MTLDPKQLKQLEHDVECLASATRLMIIRLLIEQPLMSVTDLAEALSIKHSNASQHLQKLSNRGFVSSVQHGNYIRYAADIEKYHGTLVLLAKFIPEALLSPGEPNANAK